MAQGGSHVRRPAWPLIGEVLSPLSIRPAMPKFRHPCRHGYAFRHGRCWNSLPRNGRIGGPPDARNPYKVTPPVRLPALAATWGGRPELAWARLPGAVFGAPGLSSRKDKRKVILARHQVYHWLRFQTLATIWSPRPGRDSGRACRLGCPATLPGDGRWCVHT